MKPILTLSFLAMILVFACKSNNVSQADIVNEAETENLDSTAYYELIQKSKSIKNNEYLVIEESEADEFNLEKIKAITEFERTILNDWIELPNYYDTLPDLKTISDQDLESIVYSRCSTIDKAKPEALRTMSGVGEKQNSFFLFELSRIEIPVRIHIINNDSGFTMQDINGNSLKKITRSHINNQLSTLNEAFNIHDIFFRLESIDSVRNTTWNESGTYYYSPRTLYEMLDSLSQTPETHLNIFIIDGRKSGHFILGEATFPWDLGAGRYDDYIVITCRSMPGFHNNSKNSANEGKTLIHEVGHYLGLWHTFEGGGRECDSPDNDGCYYGDRVPDTPAQKICHFGSCDCNKKACNTCDEPGVDPVHNYMGYNDDSCMFEFTPLQITRIYEATYFHRKQYFKSDYDILQ